MLLRGILYFLIFLLCVVIFAKVRSRAVRQAVLLTGCCALYLTWGAWFAAVLFASTVLNFRLGKWLQRKPSGIVLSIGILLNLALLGAFKYLPAIAINVPISSFQRFSHLALPLGISFWTFQAMSYLFDLYRGEELDPSFIEFALYMVVFPGHDFRANLPYARNASAISLRSRPHLGNPSDAGYGALQRGF